MSLETGRELNGSSQSPDKFHRRWIRTVSTNVMTLHGSDQGWRNDSRGGRDQALGPSRKRVPECLKGPKRPPMYTIIAIAEQQSKRSKKDPFSLYIGSPGSHPRNGINGVRRGRSLLVPPGFSSHGSDDSPGGYPPGSTAVTVSAPISHHISSRNR